jgi:hypothetical protein
VQLDTGVEHLHHANEVGRRHSKSDCKQGDELLGLGNADVPSDQPFKGSDARVEVEEGQSPLAKKRWHPAGNCHEGTGGAVRWWCCNLAHWPTMRSAHQLDKHMRCAKTDVAMHRICGLLIPARRRQGIGGWWRRRHLDNAEETDFGRVVEFGQSRD